MSALTQFAATGKAAAFPTIGTKSLAIDGGTAVDCVWAEETTDRDYLDGGQQVEVSYTATCKLSEFVAAYASDPKEYEGKTATRDSKTYRVGRISKGDGFVDVTLEGGEQAP